VQRNREDRQSLMNMKASAFRHTKALRLVPAEWDMLLGQSSTPVESAFHSIDDRDGIHDKTVMITGAGGSIGSALALHLAQAKPQLLILLDASEHGLYALDQKLRARSKEVRHIAVVGSVGDADLISALCREHHPERIMHMAAYKQVPFMESNPFAAIENNALGTYRMARAASSLDVREVLMVSTDKAVNPSSIMGSSKRIAEIALQSMSSHRCRMNSLRLGNVLGTQGSVVPLFLDQIARGDVVTVTHPDAKRFVFTKSEALELICEALAQNLEGAILIPKSARSLRMVDVAKYLIEKHSASAHRSSISFIGLRPGEKIIEEFVAHDERAGAATSPHLRSIESTKLTMEELHCAMTALENSIHARDLRALLHSTCQLVPHYAPSYSRSPTVKANESAAKVPTHV